MQGDKDVSRRRAVLDTGQGSGQPVLGAVQNKRSAPIDREAAGGEVDIDQAVGINAARRRSLLLTVRDRVYGDSGDTARVRNDNLGLTRLPGTRGEIPRPGAREARHGQDR